MIRREKNVLMVSLGNPAKERQYKYFCNNDGETSRYCSSIINAEVATKYILSKANIDEVIVIGSGDTYDENDDIKKSVLSKGADFIVPDIGALSEYGMYRYRISEYLDGMDLEEHDILTDISAEEKARLIEAFDCFLNEMRKQSSNKTKKDVLFNRLNNQTEIFEELVTFLPDDLKKKAAWLKSYIYSIMTDAYKMRPLESNEDIVMSFIPTGRNHGDVNIDNISKIIEALKGGEDEFVNLYIDMQGLERTDDFTMITVLSILKNEWKNKIRIEEILSTTSGAFAGEIKNENSRYELNNLLAGMNAFIQYGKVGSLIRYWDERNVRDDHVDRLLFALQYIDDGVSLCNTKDLEFGIKELRNVLSEERSECESALDSSIINVLEAGIKRDFGPLLDTNGNDEIDLLELIKWTYRKEFYQQTLTILESRIPNEFVEKGVLYYAENEEDKERCIRLLSELYNEAAPRDRYQFRDINHYFVKSYCRNKMNYRQHPVKVIQDFAKYRIGMIGKDDPAFLKTYSVIEDKEALEELIFAYINVGGIRNRVSHGDAGVKVYPGQRRLRKENDNVRMLRDAVEYFIQQYEAVQDELNKKHAVSITVTGLEIKERAGMDSQE